MANFGLTELEQLILEVLGMSSAHPLPTTIKKQIQKFILEFDYTPKEIAQTIYYYIEVRKQKIDKLYGIWFVKDLKDDAKEYFIQLEKEQDLKKQEAQKFSEDRDILVFDISAIQKRKEVRKLKQLDFDSIKLEDGEEDGN